MKLLFTPIGEKGVVDITVNVAFHRVVLRTLINAGVQYLAVQRKSKLLKKDVTNVVVEDGVLTEWYRRVYL